MTQLNGLNPARRNTYEWLLDPKSEQFARLLEELIQAAHAVNPASWALSVAQDGSLVLFVRDVTLFLADPGPDRNYLLFEGETAGLNEAVAELGFNTWPGKKNSLSVAGLGSAALFELFKRFHDAALELARRLAKLVRTSCSRWAEHDRNLVYLLQQRGYQIPTPVWRDTQSMTAEQVNLPATSTGLWKAQYRTKVGPEREAFAHLYDRGVIELSSFSPIETSSTELMDYSDGVFASVYQEQVDWLVNSMRVGDKVVAHLDTNEFLFGEVEGEATGSPNGWSRPINWAGPATPVSSSNRIELVLASGRMLGIAPVSKSLFDDMGRQSAREDGEGVSTSDQLEVEMSGTETQPLLDSLPSQLRHHYSSRGLNYTSTQLAEFYTALQTKGFVVLSGISGTGKSKIAQHFTEMLPTSIGPSPVAITEFDDDDRVWTRIQPYNTKYSKVMVPRSGDVLFPPLDYRKSVVTSITYMGEIHPARMYLETSIALHWQKDLNEKLKPLPPGTPFALRPVYPDEERSLDTLQTIEFTLDVPQHVLETNTLSLENTLFLSVRPDWRDGTSLLGYYNPLTQSYEWTEFLRFVVEALDNWRSGNPVAWFVILDEMNLAHVEYYFADLLSVLESGRFTATDGSEKDGLTREAIRLTYPESVTSDAPPAEIHLPPNLYFIGTVNMDETTHAFSPKVLDRAFTMELSEVDFSDYLLPGSQPESGFEPADPADVLEAFTSGGWPIIDKQAVSAFATENTRYRFALQSLNMELRAYRFHFGYRVFDEIMQFMVRAKANQLFEDLDDAFDSAVFMKVLPKFSGSESRIGAPLQALQRWTQDPFEVESVVLPRTHARVSYMYRRLLEDGFVTAF